MSVISKNQNSGSSLSPIVIGAVFLALVLSIGIAPAQPQPAPQPSSVSVSPASATHPRSGSVFSPLPADLSPTNQASKQASSSETPNVNKSMEDLDDKHSLATGDRISFRIKEDEEESKALVVADSGEIELPGSLGRFAAKGKTCKELARIIKTELEREFYYQATVLLAVDLMARSRGNVYLVGPVRAPGPLEIPSGETLTLSKAILRAGGFTDFADKKAVKVTRKKEGAAGAEQVFKVNVAEILEKGRTEFDLPLEPGDLIYVAERTIRF